MMEEQHKGKFWFRWSPVIWRGEGCHDDVMSVDVDDIGDGLQDVEVEMRVTRD